MRWFAASLMVSRWTLERSPLCPSPLFSMFKVFDSICLPEVVLPSLGGLAPPTSPYVRSAEGAEIQMPQVGYEPFGLVVVIRADDLPQLCSLPETIAAIRPLLLVFHAFHLLSSCCERAANRRDVRNVRLSGGLEAFIVVLSN